MPPGTDDYCLYELLGVDADASPDQLRNQYRRLMQKSHPDMGGTADAAAQLNRAYQILSDPVARADYDQRLSILRRVARGLQFTKSDTNNGVHRRQDPVVDTSRTCPFCGAAHNDGPLLAESRCDSCESPLARPLVTTMFADGRRAAHRSPRSVAVQFMPQTDHQQVHPANTQDLSMAGVLLVSKQSLQKGERVRIVSDVFEAVGEVARSQQRCFGWQTQFLTGLRFHTLHMLRTTGGFVSEKV